MIGSRLKLILAATLGFFLTLYPANAQFGFDQSPSKATVTAVADVTSVQPGKPFFAGVQVEIAPGWHTYWKNAGGITGSPTTVSWELPEGFVVGDLLFSTPHFKLFGEFSNHVYEGTVYHIAQFTPPATIEPGANVTIKGNIDLLVCNEFSCEPPQSRSISISLPVSADEPQASEFSAKINETLDDSALRLPKWNATAKINGENVVIDVSIPDGQSAPQEGLYFFPDFRDMVVDGKEPQKFAVNGQTLTISIPKEGDAFNGDISGILVADAGFGGIDGQSVVITTGGKIDAPAVEEKAVPSLGGNSIDDLSENEKEEIRAANKEIASWFKGTTAVSEDESTTPSTDDRKPLLLMIFFAFLGGMILNLMPCVFPVLGIKIMGFVNQAGEDKATIRKHGLVFALGVIISLWALVAVLLLLKFVGKEAGWGFQLQDPRFLAVMIIILFAFGLNLSGLFEIGTSLTAAGSGLQQKHGYSGSFFSGILAVLVATPCTGPFMGPAIAFALTGSAAQTFIVFTALGLGLALPYVLLSYFPYLIQKLPKPGAWMETFKQFMAFPLFATVIWLLGVFGKITGLGGISYLLFGLMILALGLWIFGRFATPFKPKNTKLIAQFATIAVALSGGYLIFQGTTLSPPSKEFGATEERHGILWQHYDPRKIVAARNSGRNIFIDYTADW